MLKIDPAKILVCVSPGEDCAASLDYAVAEAAHRGCGIHLAMAIRPMLSGTAGVIDLRLIDGEWRKYGTDFLIDCERKVKAGLGAEVAVSTEITHGAVVPTLSELSHNAALVVMQHHRMGRRHHIPSRSTTDGVAARAEAPVVAVPDDWQERAQRKDVVVVGVKDAISSARVAEWAFEEARRLSGSVRLVRAWFFSAAFDADVFAGEAGRVQSASVQEEVRRDFAELIRRYPDVTCEVVATHGPTADVLVALSRGARRVVLGRHDPLVPFGSHLGPVTRAVLDHASCPVVVLDPLETRRLHGKPHAHAADAPVAG
jgi:nucleotide-binding universal stress UspA family protein